MPEDLIIDSDKIDKMEDEAVGDPSFEEQLTTDIANLSSALSSLSEVDSGLMNKTKQAKLKRMKRLIFDALCYYCDCLPQLIEDDKEESDDD